MMPTPEIMDALNALQAAISLLERSPKTGASSDRMFDIMLADYKRVLRIAKASLEVSYDRG